MHTPGGRSSLKRNKMGADLAVSKGVPFPVTRHSPRMEDREHLHSRLLRRQPHASVHQPEACLRAHQAGAAALTMREIPIGDLAL
jgi:hypothetical protein